MIAGGSVWLVWSEHSPKIGCLFIVRIIDHLDHIYRERDSVMCFLYWVKLRRQYSMEHLTHFSWVVNVFLLGSSVWHLFISLCLSANSTKKAQHSQLFMSHRPTDIQRINGYNGWNSERVCTASICKHSKNNSSLIFYAHKAHTCSIIRTRSFLFGTNN